MEIKLRTLQLQDQDAFNEACVLWDSDKGFHWNQPKPGQSFQEFIEQLRDEEKGINLPQNYVPCTKYFAFNENKKIVGSVSF